MVDPKKNKTPSTLSALLKVRELLSREEKLKWLGIVCFAGLVSLLEVVTASIIVIFAQVVNDPIIGLRYLIKLGVTQSFSPERTLLYIAIAGGSVYLIKNMISAGETFRSMSNCIKYTLKWLFLSWVTTKDLEIL